MYGKPIKKAEEDCWAEEDYIYLYINPQQLFNAFPPWKYGSS